MAEKMGCVSEMRRRWTHTMEWMAFAGRLWQRNDYEPIIGNEESLNRIHLYILDTPAELLSNLVYDGQAATASG